MREERVFSPLRAAIVAVIVVVVIFVFALTFLNSVFGYLLQDVSATEIGVLTKYGSFVRVLPPGQYNDPFDWGANIQNVSVTGIQFSYTDPQVALTGGTDNITQTVGITVAGTVFRPGAVSRTGFRNVVNASTGEVSQEPYEIPALDAKLWSDNFALYTNQDTLLSKMNELAAQAIKVCVGPRTVAEAAVGNNRNDTAFCVDEQITELANAFALDVQTVTVPDVILPAELEQSIIQIAAAQQAAQQALAQATQAIAEGIRDQSVVKAQILVTAASQNEQLYAKSTSAAIEQTAISGQQQVLIAQATTTALYLDYGLSQAQIELQIANLNAQSETAQISQLAVLYQTYPQYAAVIISTAYAKGLEAVDKVFYIPADTTSLNVIGGGLVNQNGQVVPIVPLTPGAVVATPVP